MLIKRTQEHSGSDRRGSVADTMARQTGGLDRRAFLRRSGLALMLLCVVVAGAEVGGPAGTATTFAVLAAVTILLTLGEMWQSAGAWGLSLALSPPHS